MVCPNCKAGYCEGCVDVLRAAYSDEKICACVKQGHSGEPSAQQVLDPESGDVYAPGLIVHEDGTVERDEEAVADVRKWLKEMMDFG